jgi:hypothetical protein
MIIDIPSLTQLPLKRGLASMVATATLCLVGATSWAQSSLPADPPSTAKAEAPFDLTGHWVSVVTQDWQFRMVVPAKGEYIGVPMSPEAKRFADAWSPEADIASRQECKAYGAGSVMRIPERLRISWQDDDTLKVETDAGQQTRLLQFKASEPDAALPATLQGLSQAQWLFAVGAFGGFPEPVLRGPAALPTPFQIAAHEGSLKVVTTHVSPGYLRKNGIPYGAQLHMLEYWHVYKDGEGRDWLFIATEIDDPQYLQSAYDVTPIFRREPDGSKFSPSRCSLTQ